MNGSVKKLVGYVIDIIRKKDIFGLADYDNDDCRETLKMQLGWVATTLYHSHLFLMHRRCSGIKLTDFQQMSLDCPMAGQTVRFPPPVALFSSLYSQ